MWCRNKGRRYTVRRGEAAGDFIAKLPSTKFRDLVLNEGICMRLAGAAGVTTARTEVRPVSDLNVPEHGKEEFGEFLLEEAPARVRRTISARLKDLSPAAAAARS